MDAKKILMSFRLSEAQSKQLAEFAAAAGLTRTELLERALERYLGSEAEAHIAARLEAVRRLNKKQPPSKG